MNIVCLTIGTDEVSEGKDELPTAYHGDSCKEHQGEGHGKRTLVGGMFSMQFFVLRTPKDTVVEAEHIECRHSCNHRHNPSHRGAELEASCQYLIFGEEAGERGNTGYGKASYEEGDVRDRHILPQSAHGRHFVAMYRMDNAAGSQEKQCLEHGVGEQMVHTCHITQSTMMRVGGCTYAERHHHKTNLRDGGECQYPLDIALHTGHCGGIESGKCSYVCYDVQHAGGAYSINSGNIRATR